MIKNKSSHVFSTGDGSRQRGRRLRRAGALGAMIAAVLVGTLPAASALNAAPTNRASSSSPTPAVPRVTFGIEPASATGADGRPNFSFGVTPGALVYDHVAALNYSAVPLSLQLYATDAIETAGGGFGLLPGTARPTGVGAWITLPPGTATVTVPPATANGPGEYVTPFTVHVPDNATPGDHVGGILAQLQTVGSNSSGQRVVLDQRIGTRVYLRVSGPLHPEVAIADEHVAYQGTLNPVGQGKVKVSYVIHNTGNVVLALKHLSVTVSGVVGTSKSVKLAPVTVLLPGASVTKSAVVPGVWPQVYLHVNQTLTAATRQGAKVPGFAPYSSSVGLLAIPWGLIVVIIVVAAIVLVWLRLRRQKKRKRALERESKSDEPAALGARPKGRAIHRRK